MKDTWSLLIFVLLLFTIVSMSLYQYFSQINSWFYNDNNVEGFIAFQRNTQSLDVVAIPQYSPTASVFKLYDNYYFDNTNGNLIQVDGLGYDASGNNVDRIGTSINSLVVTKRDNSLGSVTINTNLNAQGNIGNFTSPESQMQGYSVPFAEWIVASSTTSTDNYQVLYIAWNDYTFIDIIDNTVSTSIVSTVSSPVYLLGALFNDDVPNKQIPISIPASSGYGNQIHIVAGSNYTNHQKDNKTRNQPLYNNRPVYQVTSFLQFDTVNGNLLLIANADGSNPTAKIYDRHMTDLSSLTDYSLLDTHISSIPYTPYVFHFDPVNSTPASPIYFIYYIAFNQNTIIVILQKASSTTSPFQIVKVARFDTTGFVTPTHRDKHEPKPKSTPKPAHGGGLMTKLFGHGHDGDGEGDGDGDGDGSNVLDASTDALLTAFLLREQMNYLDTNYIPKSQIVPPVFPVVQSCPACGHKGHCSNCGHDEDEDEDSSGNYYGNSYGHGHGYGKVGNSGSGNGGGGNGGGENGITSFSNNLVNASTGLVNNTVGGAVDLTKTAFNDTVDLTKAAGSGTVGFINNVGSGVAGAVNGAASGTVGLVKDTVGGTVDLTKQAVGGTVDLTKQIVGGTANFLTGGAFSSGAAPTPAAAPAPGAPATATTTQTNGNAPLPYYLQPGYTTQPIQYHTNNVPGVDAYSYYGSLPNQSSSDFMPLTASFSGFKG